MKLLDWLFPKACYGCGKLGYYLCQSCISRLPQSDLVCPACERASIGGLTHPLCQRKYGLDGLWSLGSYQNPLKEAIHKLKYRFVADLASTLVDLMLDYWVRFTPAFFDEIRKEGVKNWQIVPVPLHFKRERSRGFNQSALLGKLLASKMGLKYSDALARIKNTKSQVGLESQARKANIKDAFSLTSRFTLNANILLIDDVWTTGSTLKECCYILKRGGANKVWALTLAR